MSDHKDFLDDLDEEHNPESVTDTFGELQDNKYQVNLNKIYFHETDNGTKIVVEFEVISGNTKGRTIWKWINLQSETNLDYAVIDLRRLGLPTKFEWKDVPGFFPQLLDKTYDIELKTKNGFQNVYINKEIKVTSGNSGNKKKSIFGEDDDIPF